MILAPAFLTFLYIPQVALSQSTPRLGLEERVSSYAYNVWQGLLVLVPLPNQKLMCGIPTQKPSVITQKNYVRLSHFE